MSEFLFKIKNNFTFTLVIFFIIISIILYFVDRQKFMENGDKKEELAAKIISIVYLIGSISIYLLIQIMI